MFVPSDAADLTILSDPSTDLVINVASYERVLKRTRLFAVGEVRCSPNHPRFKMGGGPQSCPYIDFMRSTVIRATDEHRPTVLSSNCANFQNVGSIYERQVVDQRGDLNDWIAVSPSFLAELSADRASSTRAAKGVFFDQAVAPITARQYMAQRHIFDAVANKTPLSDLAFDEYLTELVQSVVSSADRHWQKRSVPKSSLRPVCNKRRREVVEAVKERLARECSINHSLADLARGTRCSISKLVRIFRLETGFSLHAYQQHARIRTSLQLLLDSHSDLNDIAGRLGFASHAHFTSVFRQQFGVTPSEYRRKPTSQFTRRCLETMTERVTC